MYKEEQPATLTRLFQTELAVIEVKAGESQEEAWKRHLAANPATAFAHIKIFHYPAPKGLKTATGHLRHQQLRQPGDHSHG